MKKIAFLIALLLVFGCRSQTKMQKITVQYSHPETKNDKLALDIYPVDGGKNLPVVIFVHGGAWILGDKATKIDSKVKLFNDKNYVFVSVNYRLSSFFNSSVQYPSHPNDVADAVQWISQNISKYGGNPDNMVLLGHSAGAQIVSLLGTSEEFLPKRGIPLNKIKGVASIDTEGYDVSGIAAEGVKIYRHIFGDSPEIWKQASPLAQISAGKPYPNFLVATRGENYRKEMSKDFVNALKNAGAKAELMDVDPYSHFESNNKIGTPGDTVVTPKLMRFLGESFAK